MTKKELINQYIDTGMKIPEYQLNKLSDSQKNTYFRKRIIATEQTNVTLVEYEIKLMPEKQRYKYINNLSDYNVYYLLKYATDKQEMANIILKYKGNNLSDINVYYLLYNAEDQQEMANILGKDNINKLSDNNVYSLLKYATDKQEMANILGKDNKIGRASCRERVCQYV